VAHALGSMVVSPIMGYEELWFAREGGIIEIRSKVLVHGAAHGLRPHLVIPFLFRPSPLQFSLATFLTYFSPLRFGVGQFLGPRPFYSSLLIMWAWLVWAHGG